MIRKRLALVICALWSMVLVDPASATAGCPLDWGFYCEDLQDCEPCWHTYEFPLQLESFEQFRDINPTEYPCVNWPSGWSKRCVNFTSDGNYLLTINLFYEHIWNGGRFEVFVNGRSLGVTEAPPAGWGYPFPGDQGHPIGSFTTPVCPGQYKVEFKELTMRNANWLEVCDKSMLAIRVGVGFRFSRPGGSAPEFPVTALAPRVDAFGPGSETGAPIVRVAPNPSSGATWLTFGRGGGVPGDLEFGIFDVRGARVWNWQERSSGREGEIRVRWDGRTNQGALAPNGIYFVRGRYGSKLFQSRLIRANAPPTGSPGLSAATGSTDESGTAGARIAPPRFAPTTFVIGEEEESPPGGGGPPPPQDIEGMLNRIQPYMRLRPDSTVWVDTVLARSHGVTEQTIREVVHVYNFVNEAIRAGRDPRGWAAKRLFQLARDVLVPAIEDFVDVLPGGHPCGSFRNQYPCPEFQCGQGGPWATKQEVVDHLLSLGYTPGEPGHGEAPGGELYVKPFTSPSCQSGLLRKTAYVIGCSCTWTYYFSDMPEPDLDSIHRREIWPTDWWLAYVYWWYARKCTVWEQPSWNGCCP